LRIEDPYPWRLLYHPSRQVVTGSALVDDTSTYVNFSFLRSLARPFTVPWGIARQILELGKEIESWPGGPSTVADGDKADFRKGVRYALQAPISFSWKDERGVSYCGEGHTVNISVRGAFVLAVACPPVGADVDLIILLPVRSEMPWTFRIRAKARVLQVERADPSEERKRFAVSFRRAKWE